MFSNFPSKKPSVGALNDYEKIFLTIGNFNPHNKIYSENERVMFYNAGNMRKKEDRRSYVGGAVVVPEKMGCAASVKEM